VARRRYRQFVVWVSANEKIEIAIADRSEIMANHVAYNARLLPARDKDRDSTFLFEKLA
jgi:hypothetical protein